MNLSMSGRVYEEKQCACGKETNSQKWTKVEMEQNNDLTYQAIIYK